VLVDAPPDKPGLSFAKAVPAETPVEAQP